MKGFEIRVGMKVGVKGMEGNVAAVFTNAGFAEGDFKVMVRADSDGSATVYSIEFVDDGIQKLMNYVHSGRARSRKPTLPLFASGDSSLADDVSAEFGSE